MALTRRRATSARDLKALGHPLRLELLDLLVRRGPLTATDAAALLAQSPSNVSWHLRRLADQGFVRQARSGPGRRRPWKAVVESVEAAGDQAAAEVADDEVVFEREFHALRSTLAGPRPVGWEGLMRLQRRELLLTTDQAAELVGRLQAVLTSYEDQQDARKDARPVSVVTWMLPGGPPD